MHHFSVLSKFQLCLITVLCSVLISCNSSSGEQIDQFEKPFFDLQAYFQSEVERLNEKNPALKKEVTFNGSVETQEINLDDFTQELKLFKDADINRRALLDKYQADSLVKKEQIAQLTYLAMDSSLNVRKIMVDYNNGEITQIDVYKKQKSFVGFSEQHLRYQPQEGYFINSLQKTVLSNPKQLTIKTFFQ